MSSTNLDTLCQSSSLPECHWELCHRFITRYQHLFRDGQVATLAHFFANTQLLLLRGDADQTRQLVQDLVRDQAEGKHHEMGNVENTDRKQPGQESVPTEVVIKREARVDDTSFAAIKQEPIEVSESCDEPSELVREFVVESGTLASEHHSKYNCSSTGPPTAKPPKRKHLKPESDAKIIAELTYFKPVQQIRKIEDLYRNLVICDSDFEKTYNELKRLGSGSLFVIGREFPNRQCCGTVKWRDLILAEAWDSTVQSAKEKAKAKFFRIMKVFCYQIVSKKPNLPAVQIARLEDPATNIEHYKSIMQKITEETTQLEITFSEEFSWKELSILKRIARGLNLDTCYHGPRQAKRALKVRSRTVPALAIVERIVVHKDPELGKQYDVFPPRAASRRRC